MREHLRSHSGDPGFTDLTEVSTCSTSHVPILGQISIFQTSDGNTLGTDDHKPAIVESHPITAADFAQTINESCTNNHCGQDMDVEENSCKSEIE